MKKIIIDTNCLISFVSDRNIEQQEKISNLFREAGRLKKTILCHHHVISEFKATLLRSKLHGFGLIFIIQGFNLIATTPN